MIKRLLLTSLFILLLSFYLSAQNTIENPVPFYKWEVGIDLLPLVDKSKDAFGYIVKRNFELENGRKAFRFKLLPRFLSGPGTGSGADEKRTTINLAIGYERQRAFGYFAVLYGFEPYFRYSSIRVLSTATGLEANRQTNTNLGVAGFIGGRYYVGNHLSFTLESHLIYQYQDFNGRNNVGSVASYFQRSHQLFVEPIHALYVGYQF